MSKSALFLEAMSAYDSGDAVTALRLMEACAGHGDPAACFTVALWYGGEDGFPVDQLRSKQWLDELERLAEMGVPDAQWELGQHCRFGNLFPRSVERANYWLERAANGGHGDAQHHLAWFLETGQYGYSVNADLAATWYQRAFEQENPETLYLFAVRQFKDGQPTDEAIRLLHKAADKGFKQAEHVLNSYTH